MISSGKVRNLIADIKTDVARIRIKLKKMWKEKKKEIKGNEQYSL